MRWIPAGSAVSIAGLELPDGLLYVGADGLAASGFGTEPAQINPALPVEWTGTLYPMGYWPSYGDISPRQRGEYLAWLASGRSAPTIDIGFVFLFFYGLERRAISDLKLATESVEMQQIAAEVRRLLGVYSQSNSFNSYASQFLDLISVVPGSAASDRAPTIRGASVGQMPLSVRVAVGRFVALSQPIPAEWALAYLRSHFDGRLRTVASRCADEFDALFLIRYRRTFGVGIVLRPLASRLQFEYRPASRGIVQPVLRRLDDLPDVVKATSLIDKLQVIASECDDALSGYSRFLGRTGATRADAIALLPRELLATAGGAELTELRNWMTAIALRGEPCGIGVKEVLSRTRVSVDGKVAKSDAVAMATLLGKFGVGVVPDARFGDPVPALGDTARLFVLPPDAPVSPSPEYTAAATLIYFSAIIASADGSVTPPERKRISDHVQSLLHLDDAERRRLDAVFHWLADRKQSLAGIKRRVDALTDVQRSAIGRWLADLAMADNVVTPDEVRTLIKLYRLLRIDEQEVYRALHAAGGDSGPVAVSPPEPATRWQIPPQPSSVPHRVELDPEKVRARIAETAAVTAVLTGIFTDDADIERPVVPQKAVTPVQDQSSAAASFGGLDSAHTNFARRLCAQEVWTRAEAEDAAVAAHLPLLDGALDRINETTLDICGEPLIEGDDPLIVNTLAKAVLLQ